VFETWLETCLIPTLKPGQIVIADHATFMKGGRIFQLIEAAGCQLKYLLPYSPELNKIERCWSWLKSRIRKQLIQFYCRAGCHGSCASHSGLTALAVAIQLFRSSIRFLINEPIANRSFHNIDELELVLFQRCLVLLKQPSLIKELTCFHWWPKTTAISFRCSRNRYERYTKTN
jgi:transposase